MEIDELLELESKLRQATGRRLLIADAILIAVCATTYLVASRIASPETMIWIGIVCFMTAGLQVVVVICIVAELLGYPVELSMGLEPTQAGRVFIHELKQRPTISDDEFTSRFASRYEISGDELKRVRKVLRDVDPLCDCVEPQEVLG
ncbi:MAG TPA: hypothetical protein VM452_12625, partial [Caulifigura sp.]|nr:hypothetical protein [Caulifigura sp.]